MEPQRLNEYLARPREAYTANTLTAPDQLRQELAQIRVQGYAWNYRERDSDLVSIAAPVYDADQHVVAALCIFGPFFRFPPPDQRDELIQLVVATAGRLSHQIQALTLRTKQNGVFQHAAE